MWKSIDSPGALKEIFKGNIIADRPYSQRYVVIDISHRGYVTAIRDDGLNEVKMLLSVQLIKSKWWVKE